MTTSLPKEVAPCLCGKHSWNARLGCWISFGPDKTPNAPPRQVAVISSFHDCGAPPCAPGAKRSLTTNQHLRIARMPGPTPHRTRIV